MDILNKAICLSVSFLIVITLASNISLSTAKTIIAYDCDKPNFERYEDIERCISFDNCSAQQHILHSQLSYHSVAYSHSVGSVLKHTNEVLVMVQGKTYLVWCAVESVATIPTNKCFADEAMPVRTKSGAIKYRNKWNFLDEFGVQKPCTNEELSYKIVEILKQHSDIRVGSESLSQCLLRQNNYIDISEMLSNKSVYNLIALEESYFSNDPTHESLITRMMIAWRKYSSRVHMTILVVQILSSISLMLVGLYFRLPLYRSLSLAFGMVKKFADLLSYVKLDRLTRQESVARLHRSQMNRPEAAISQLASFHFTSIYEAIMTLTDRVQLLEENITIGLQRVSSIENCGNRSRSTTPSSGKASIQSPRIGRKKNIPFRNVRFSRSTRRH